MIAPTGRKRASPLHSLPTLREGKSFYDKNGVVVVQKCVRSATVNELMRLLRSKTPLHDKRASGRKTLCIDPNSEEAKLLYDDKRLQKVFKALHSFDLRQSEFPIEYRIYPSASPGMPWHQDTPMTSPNQIEIVLTLYNNNRGGRFVMEDENNRRHEVSTESADIAFVRPDSALHKITKLTKQGDRAIIKFIAVPPRAQRLPAFATEIEHCPTAQNPSFAKRKREDTDLDNPCEDNVEEFGEGYFHSEPRCEGEGHEDVVTGDNIRENKGICAGKQCADFDSYVASVRAMAENGYNSNTDTHEVIDPFNRQPITLAALAKARPPNGMPVAEVIAPLSKDKRLDENYQFDAERQFVESIQNVLTNASVDVDFDSGIDELDVHERIITNAAGVAVHMVSLAEAINSEDITSDVARQLGFAELAFKLTVERDADGEASRSKVMFVRIPYMQPNMVTATKVVVVYNKGVTRGTTFTVLSDMGQTHDNHYVAVQARRPQLSNITRYVNMLQGNVMKRQTFRAAASPNEGKEIWFSGVDKTNYDLSRMRDPSGRQLDQDRPRVIVQDLSGEYRDLLRQHLLSVGRKILPASTNFRNIEDYAEQKLYLEFVVSLHQARNSTSRDTVMTIPYSTLNLKWPYVWVAIPVGTMASHPYVPSEIVTESPLHATQSPTQAKSQSPSRSLSPAWREVANFDTRETYGLLSPSTRKSNKRRRRAPSRLNVGQGRSRAQTTESELTEAIDSVEPLLQEHLDRSSTLRGPPDFQTALTHAEKLREQMYAKVKARGVAKNRPRGRAPSGKTWDSESGQWRSVLKKRPPGRAPSGKTWDSESGQWRSVPKKRPPGRAPSGKTWDSKSGQWRDLVTDNSVRRPLGRTPRGMKWNTQTGRWEPHRSKSALLCDDDDDCAPDFECKPKSNKLRKRRNSSGQPMYWYGECERRVRPRPSPPETWEPIHTEGAYDDAHIRVGNQYQAIIPPLVPEEYIDIDRMGTTVSQPHFQRKTLRNSTTNML